MSRSPERKNRGKQAGSKRQSYLIIGLVFALLFVGCAVTFVFVGRGMWNAVFQEDVPTENAASRTWAKDSANLTLAVSPGIAPTLAQRVEAFNGQSPRTPVGRTRQAG